MSRIEHFSIKCENGTGEAYREGRARPWVVLLPHTSFNKRGTVPQIQAAIRRQTQKGLDGKVVSFGPLRIERELNEKQKA